MPVAMAATPLRPATATGVSTSVVVPLPIWPWVFLPQHLTVPSPDRAQVWLSLEARVLLPVSPDTGTGLALSVVVPLPSWPELFQPQQLTVQSVSNAQVCPLPAAMAFAFNPGTTTGVSNFDPKRHSVVSAKRAQVWP
jgi:hypothetical protein